MNFWTDTNIFLFFYKRLKYTQVYNMYAIIHDGNMSVKGKFRGLK